MEERKADTMIVNPLTGEYESESMVRKYLDYIDTRIIQLFQGQTKNIIRESFTDELKNESRNIEKMLIKRQNDLMSNTPYMRHQLKVFKEEILKEVDFDNLKSRLYDELYGMIKEFKETKEIDQDGVKKLFDEFFVKERKEIIEIIKYENNYLNRNINALKSSLDVKKSWLIKVVESEINAKLSENYVRSYVVGVTKEAINNIDYKELISEITDKIINSIIKKYNRELETIKDLSYTHDLEIKKLCREACFSEDYEKKVHQELKSLLSQKIEEKFNLIEDKT